MSGWISVRNWRKFQHYDPTKRVPPWIKNNTELMADDAYLGLSGHDRGVLHGLWLEYASARCRLRLDTRSISRRLGLRVTMATIERLSDAGFLEIVASEALADGYQVATPEVEVETEPPNPPSGKVNICPECGLECKSSMRLAEHRETVHHVEPLRAVS